jgi:hypothetical protein
LPKEAVKKEDSGGCYYAKKTDSFLQIIALQIFCNTKITRKKPRWLLFASADDIPLYPYAPEDGCGAVFSPRPSWSTY